MQGRTLAVLFIWKLMLQAACVQYNINFLPPFSNYMSHLNPHVYFSLGVLFHSFLSLPLIFLFPKRGNREESKDNSLMDCMSKDTNTCLMGGMEMPYFFYNTFWGTYKLNYMQHWWTTVAQVRHFPMERYGIKKSESRACFITVYCTVQ